MRAAPGMARPGAVGAHATGGLRTQSRRRRPSAATCGHTCRWDPPPSALCGGSAASGRGPIAAAEGLNGADCPGFRSPRDRVRPVRLRAGGGGGDAPPPARTGRRARIDRADTASVNARAVARPRRTGAEQRIHVQAIPPTPSSYAYFLFCHCRFRFPALPVRQGCCTRPSSPLRRRSARAGLWYDEAGRKRTIARARRR